MNEMNQKQRQTRESLRAIGLLLTAVGGLLSLIGLISFFSAFNSFEPPRYFWCTFIGFPLVGIGGSLMRYGYLGAVTKYVAGEVAPVAKDTINYLVNGTDDALQQVGRAVGAGMAAGGQRPAGALVRCHKCNQENPSDAKFCAQCGAAQRKAKPCPCCGELNDPDAKFCDNCGTAFTA